MAKIATDLEQSKKLAKILPLESADMYWDYDVQKHEYYPMVMDEQFDDTCVRAWSLAVLYSILPNNKKESTTLSRGGWKIESFEYLNNWWCEYEDESHTKDFAVSADNPVDACVTIIERLHEQKLL